MKRLLMLAVLLAPLPASARDLAIGLSQSTTSLDPLFYVAGSNTEVALNLFEQLVQQDARQKLTPGLARSWKPVDDSAWELQLRPGVTFQDGSPFGAEDVLASVHHIQTITGSPSSLRAYTAGIAGLDVVSPTVLRIRTNGPRPLLPNDLSRIANIPRALADAQPTEFDIKAVGTGPYRLMKYTPSAGLELRRYAGYWGASPAWDHMQLRFITNDGARVAAVLAGDVQVIDAVPSESATLFNDPTRGRFISTPGNRLIYLHLDSDRDVTPFVRPAAGQTLAHNPLRDVRVRRALSLAINREALVNRIMDGRGNPAGQYVPAGYPGYDPDIAVPKADPAEVKQLLAEAGYPHGFGLTIHGPNDRYPNDAKLLQAIAQQFSRAGIPTEVDTQPGASFFARASRLEFSVILGGAAVETGEATGVLNPLMATFDAGAGAGTGNRGRWSNTQFDALLATAYRTFDDEKRDMLLRQASRIATDAVAVIPVLWLAQSWAVRPGYDLLPRTDGYTIASTVVPQ